MALQKWRGAREGEGYSSVDVKSLWFLLCNLDLALFLPAIIASSLFLALPPAITCLVSPCFPLSCLALSTSCVSCPFFLTSFCSSQLIFSLSSPLRCSSKRCECRRPWLSARGEPQPLPLCWPMGRNSVVGICQAVHATHISGGHVWLCLLSVCAVFVLQHSSSTLSGLTQFYGHQDESGNQRGAVFWNYEQNDRYSTPGPRVTDYMVDAD
mmetsp:Transcript_14340/g.30273  ORF Transcript_14340/g.30273 Transcript_14340/m.30273 type:complete len:211 (-) Transcript_14340:176-808(-)